jgi:polysaccharide biosynthesis/export protein
MSWRYSGLKLNGVELRKASNEMIRMSSVLICLVAVVLAGCSTGSSRSIAAGHADAVMSAENLPPPSTGSGEFVAQPDYHLGPLDQIEVSVFEMPDFQRNLRVNANGQIALPLVGTLTAAGKTTQELESEIGQALTAEYLRTAQVSVFVTDFASQRITVDGAVNNPGIYPITGRTTLVQVIALGGGLNELADPTGVIIFREVNNQSMAGVYDIAAIRSGEREDPEVYGSDRVVVDFSGTRSVWRDLRTTLPLFSMLMFGF